MAQTTTHLLFRICSICGEEKPDMDFRYRNCCDPLKCHACREEEKTKFK